MAIAFVNPSGGAERGRARIVSVDVANDQITVAATVASVAAGDYVVRFRNAGAVYHEVAIKDATGEVLRRVSAGPGQTVKMEVSLPRGQYELGCFEPGHYEGGMHRLLSVT
jgi:plastocyanin